MMFQGQYPKEAAELKRDLEKEKARIKREFNTSEGSAVFLASEPASQEPEEEKNQLREAKENYKTQMMFQGQYPKEAADLKRDLEKEKARIKMEFNTSEGSAVFL